MASTNKKARRCECTGGLKRAVGLKEKTRQAYRLSGSDIDPLDPTEILPSLTQTGKCFVRKVDPQTTKPVDERAS
jgi:hypothetical protein